MSFDTIQKLRDACVCSESTGCLIWTHKSLSKEGYGQVWSGGKKWLAHRLSFTLARGPVDPALDLDHLCRNRACINPDHLEPVTRGVNVRRGDSPRLSALRQTSKTHCRNGHPYSEENTYVRPRGDRLCRTCHRAQSLTSMRISRSKAAAAISNLFPAVAA